MGIFVFAVCSIILIIVGYILKTVLLPRRLKDVENRHVVITGGSSGIGKSVAIVAAQYGANVTIIARNTQKLQEAKDEIIKVCKNPDKQRVEYLSLDISKNYEEVEKALHGLESNMGPIYMLVNCAGTAICGKIEDTTIDNLKHMINLNFLGTYYCIKAVVPKMKSAKEGIIVLTSSQAAVVGIFGYSAYCSTKFAVRGLAECTAMEMLPHNVSVTLCLPPDTDTPGFEVEERSKPLETKLISECAGLVSPHKVAKQLFDDALACKFFSTTGFEGFILSILCTGMSPFSSWSEVLLQSALMGIMRIISAFYLVSFHKIILNCMKKRDQSKKSN